MPKQDTRVSELVSYLESVGAPVDDAMNEAVLRSMGGSPFYAALKSVCEDYAQGLWPESLTTEVVGESWEICDFCAEDFLPKEPGDVYCSSLCEERAEGI